MEKIMERRKVTFERIPELTEEEQEVLDAIKMAIKGGDECKRYTIEEVKEMFGIEDW